MKKGPQEIIDEIILLANELAKIVGSSKLSQQVHKKGASGSSNSTRRKEGVSYYIIELRNDGFFSERRTISDIQEKLEEEGHIYPINHLSTPRRRLVVKKELRRMKENGAWVYVNR